MYNHLRLVKLSTVATHHIWSSRLVEAVSCCENCCLVEKRPTALNLRYQTNQVNKGHLHQSFTMIEITLWFWLRNSSVGIFESVHFPPLGKCWLLPKICCWRYSWFPGPQPTASLLAWHDFCFNNWPLYFPISPTILTDHEENKTCNSERLNIEKKKERKKENSMIQINYHLLS